MRLPRLPISAAFGFPLGATLGLLVTPLLVASGAPGLSLITMVAVVDGIAMISTYRAALATAMVCWALHSTFVIGEYGELTLSSESRNDALVLMLCALTALAFAATLRNTRSLLHQRMIRSPGWQIPTQRTSSPEPRSRS
ncbi:hypothetical protein [Allokutzneria oryzae]|uniref:Uncharacterized protein n=1 Tax=Allokutzneria oryzae TaxID=1378989 RepID=A0ABV6A6Z4_9PSEU